MIRFTFLFFSLLVQAQNFSVLVNSNNFTRYEETYPNVYRLWLATNSLADNYKKGIFSNTPEYKILTSEISTFKLLDFYYFVEESIKIRLESIENIQNNLYKIKLSSYDFDGNIIQIFNLIARFDSDTPVFLSNMNISIKEFQKINHNNIVYYVKDFDIDNANKFCDKIKYFNNFYGINLDTIKYFKFKSNWDLYDFKGFDYIRDKFIVNNSSVCIPEGNVIFSGNNSEINVHELIHIYNVKKFNRVNNILDEGLATYFGGSLGLSLNEHLIVLKNHIGLKKIDFYDQLFNGNYVINNTTSLRYTLGGLICKIVLENYGKDKLFELLTAGTQNDEIFSKLETILKIKRTDFNDYILNYINKIE